MTPRDDTFGDLESALRRALADEADAITPTDRLSTIRGQVHLQAPPAPRHTRWFALAVAAAVTLVSTIAIASWRVDPREAAPPAASGPVAATSTSATVVPAPGAAVPVYVLQPNPAEGADAMSLARTFVSPAHLVPSLPPDATLEARVAAALTWPAQADGATAPDPPLPIDRLRVESVVIGAADIALGLGGVDSNTGGWNETILRRSLYQLVLTAQAVVGRGDLPVRFSLVGGGGSLWGTYPTSAPYVRPTPAELLANSLAIWIDTPGSGQNLPAADPVVVSGLATQRDADLTWVLATDGGTPSEIARATVRTGPGEPRAGFRFVLPDLLPGNYRIRLERGADVTERVFTVG